MEGWVNGWTVGRMENGWMESWREGIEVTCRWTIELYPWPILVCGSPGIVRYATNFRFLIWDGFGNLPLTLSELWFGTSSSCLHKLTLKNRSVQCVYFMMHICIMVKMGESKKRKLRKKRQSKENRGIYKICRNRGINTFCGNRAEYASLS